MRMSPRPTFTWTTAIDASAPADQRYANAYLFGAICPMGAKGAALMLPFANTRAMQMHLDEISCNVAAKAHGVVLMDRAGWYSTDRHCQVN